MAHFPRVPIWHADGQFGVEHGEVWIERQGQHGHLGRRAGGDDGDRGHLRAGASGRRRQHQRQAWSLHFVDAVDVGDQLAGAGERRDQLGGVERRAAADADHDVGADAACEVDGFEHQPLRRIGDHLVEDLGGKAGLVQAGDDRGEPAGANKGSEGNDQRRAGREAGGDQRPELAAGAPLVNEGRRGLKSKRQHAVAAQISASGVVFGAEIRTVRQPTSRQTPPTSTRRPPRTTKRTSLKAPIASARLSRPGASSSAGLRPAMVARRRSVRRTSGARR